MLDSNHLRMTTMWNRRTKLLAVVGLLIGLSADARGAAPPVTIVEDVVVGVASRWP